MILVSTLPTTGTPDPDPTGWMCVMGLLLALGFAIHLMS